MKAGDTGINAHILQSSTTLTECVKIELTDGSVFGFTSLDDDITYDGLVYHKETSMTRSAFETLDNLGISNLDFKGLLNSSLINAEDIRAGLYDNADVYFFVINFKDVSDGIIKMDRSTIGNIKLQSGIFVAELRCITQKLQTNALRYVVPECDADFGDTRCGFDSDTIQEIGTVDVVTDRRTFTAIGITATDEYWNVGKITWTSGSNNGLSHEIKTSDTTPELVLYAKAPFTVSNGDTFTIKPGCLKTVTACKAYSNYDRYRGFPHVIGEDELYKYPDMVLQ